MVGTLRDLVAQHGREQVLDWAGAGGSALGVLLPDLTGGSPEADSIRLQLFEAIAQLWERASEHSPLVVIMEDIHWADESTRHLLRFLARALTDAPVMIVASYRTDELTRRHPLRPFLAEIGRLAGTVRVDVPSLERAEVAELLTRLLERPPSNPVIDTVFRRSEGIPYFVEELTRSAARGCIDMPDTLRDALNVRVQNLSEEAQQVVELAAVAGNRVEPRAAGLGGRRRRPSTSTAACVRRSTRRCSPPTRPGTASGTPCSARWCTTTCCPASTPGCTPGSPPSSSRTPSWSARAPRRWRSPTTGRRRTR